LNPTAHHLFLFFIFDARPTTPNHIKLTGPVPKGYKDSVERNFQYDAEKAIRLGKTTTKKSYAVIKPYFQY
jgi:hypothetical protein